MEQYHGLNAPGSGTLSNSIFERTMSAVLGSAREVGFFEGEQPAIHGPKIVVAGFERHGTC